MVGVAVGVATLSDFAGNDVEEEELIFLRERIETYEVEIERLRTESIVRESEKRRLAEIVKSMGENRPADSEAGAREERVRPIDSLLLNKADIF